MYVVIKLSIDISQSYFTSRDRFNFNLATYDLQGFSSINRLFRETLKNIFARKQNAQSFDIWYVTLPSGTLPNLLNLWLCGKNGLIMDVTQFTLTFN